MVGIRSPVSLVVGSCTSHPGVLGSIPKLEEPGKTGAPCDVIKYLVPHGSQVINTHYRTAHLVERKYFKGHSRNPATSLPRQGHRGHCSSIDGVLAYINVPPSNLGFQIKKDVRTPGALLLCKVYEKSGLSNAYWSKLTPGLAKSD
jgi:hypothetical protein